MGWEENFVMGTHFSIKKNVVTYPLIFWKTVFWLFENRIFFWKKFFFLQKIRKTFCSFLEKKSAQSHAYRGSYSQNAISCVHPYQWGPVGPSGVQWGPVRQWGPVVGSGVQWGPSVEPSGSQWGPVVGTPTLPCFVTIFRLWSWLGFGKIIKKTQVEYVVELSPPTILIVWPWTLLKWIIKFKSDSLKQVSQLKNQYRGRR